MRTTDTCSHCGMTLEHCSCIVLADLPTTARALARELASVPGDARIVLDDADTTAMLVAVRS